MFRRKIVRTSVSLLLTEKKKKRWFLPLVSVAVSDRSRQRITGEGRQHMDDGPAAVRSTQAVLRRSHSSSLQSDSVWLGVTSGGCFMSQAGGHMIAQGLNTAPHIHTFIKTCTNTRGVWKEMSQESNSTSKYVLFKRLLSLDTFTAALTLA